MTEQNGVERSTATEELRRMLDERGVEWWLSDDPCCEYIITHWRVGPFQWTAIEGEKDLWLNAGIAGHEPLTPEQAIAATLGQEDTYTREDVESAFVSGYSLGSLPIGSDPRWDENRQTVDEHMAELGWVRKEAATLGRGTCHDTGESRVFHCSECGFGIEDAFIEDEHAYPPKDFPRFCPWCGAEVVDE